MFLAHRHRSRPTSWRSHPARRTAVRPRLEPLEDRAVPSVLTVLNTNDAGPGSLRAAIGRANALPGPDTILFAPRVAGTITLTSPLPDLSTGLTIHGPGPSALTVARSAAAGTAEFRIFAVAKHATVRISGLTITGGVSESGGGILNEGELKVTGCTISGNSAQDIYGTSANLGGGIDNYGELTVTGCTISGNSAAAAGAIDNYGELTVTGCTISSNSASFGGGIVNYRGLTVIDCTISGNSATYGGGIYNLDNGALTVTDSTISGNFATDGGGGIYSYGQITATNCTISGNSASYGGGIVSYGALTVTDSTISGNFATDGGGGIYSYGELTVTGSAISDNSANFGGCIFNGGKLTVTGSTISGNSADGGAGGGIYNNGNLTVTGCTIRGNSASDNAGGIDNDATLTITDCTISGNSSAEGGGILNLDSSALTVTGSTISGNSATDGGGIDNYGQFAATNCTISGNSATDGGGGIYLYGELTVTDCTISDNSAPSGGGIFTPPLCPGVTQPAKATLAASIFANAAGGNIVLADASSIFVSLGHNLFTDTPAVPLDATDLVNTDPRLGPLANNGGLTLTCALLPGSPAIDAGVAIPGVTTDQRGVPRPQGHAPDIGAFEVVGPTPTSLMVVARGLTVFAPAGRWFTHPVDLFRVVSLPAGTDVPTASSFRAWVNWGDGTFSAGAIELVPDGSYQVVGSHRYEHGGTYRTTTQILAWPPGLVLAEVQGKVMAGVSGRVRDTVTRITSVRRH
jgi:parallel beta-helix repeat protein